MLDKKELKDNIIEWLKSQKWGKIKFFSVPIGQFVEFNFKGMKHAINRNYRFPEIELQIVKNIPKILPNSYYIGFDKNTKQGKDNVKGVHNYYDIVFFEGELFEVWFKIKETTDKTYFYDFGIIRKL